MASCLLSLLGGGLSKGYSLLQGRSEKIIETVQSNIRDKKYTRNKVSVSLFTYIILFHNIYVCVCVCVNSYIQNHEIICICYLQETNFRAKDIHRLKMRG